MRFNKRVTFVTDGESRYDPEIGDYVEGEKDYDTVPCNISTLRVDREKELFGEIDTSVKVVRLLRPYTKDYNYIEIDGRRQRVKTRSDYKKGVFYLERDEHG